MWAAGFLAVLLAGCVHRAVPGAVMTEEGTYLFEARGQSVIAKADDPLSLLEAELAAATMAKANLLEKVKGAFVTSNVLVGDLMLRSQEAAVIVEGFLSRATVYVEAPSPPVVTAVAMLELDACELSDLEKYVQ
jgi:hypothetical protein